MHDHSNLILATENHHMIWAGNFNRHHPLWDKDEDTHLFTQQNNRFAEGLIGLIANYNLAMPLPKGIPMLQHIVTKRYSRLDNVFNTTGLSDLITKCEVTLHLHPPSIDHFPITTNILLPQKQAKTAPSYNFREVDWDNFRHKLRARLNITPDQPINNLEQLNLAAEQLTLALQETI